MLHHAPFSSGRHGSNTTVQWDYAAWGADQRPLLTRIDNVTSTSFDIQVQRADNDGSAVSSGVEVQYVVAEEGVYTEAEHGITMEAVKFTSTQTDRKNNWGGQQRNYLGSYSYSYSYNYNVAGISDATSAVLSQTAMDGNDGGWAVLSGNNPVNGSTINLAIDEETVGDSERAHTTEQVGFNKPAN